jgi:hypothetical protein
VNRSSIDRIVSAIGAVMGVALLIASALLFYAHSYVHGQVTDQLSEQKITFPAAGSQAITSLPAADQGAINKYAGQALVNGDQAKAFADHYIKVHLSEVAGGQTYSQVSAKALANPNDQQLTGQVQTLFRGETLRGLLLNAYAFDTMAKVAFVAAWVALVGGIVLLILSVLGLLHARRPTGAGPTEATEQPAASVPA